MNPYLMTVTFLMIMSFLTSSEVARFAQSALEEKCYETSHLALAAAEELKELSQIEEFRRKHEVVEKDDSPSKKEKTVQPRKTETTKRSAPLGINTSRPPNNARLNLYMLLHHEPPKGSPKEFSLYELTARLMRRLYKEEPFFQQVPAAEYRILDKLLEKKEETKTLTSPDELCHISMDDPQLQQIFYQMMKGRPSLLNFLTFDPIDITREQKRKINFMFAPALLIEEIFQDPKMSAKVLDCRTRFWTEILVQEEHRLERTKEQNKTRTDFKKELAKEMEHIFDEEHLNFEKYKTHVFDFTLGRPGTVLFFEDPLTDELIREKITLKETE